MRHPAEHFIKFLIIKSKNLNVNVFPDVIDVGPQIYQVATPGVITNAQILHELDKLGFLAPEPNYLDLLRTDIPDPPANFSPYDRHHRPSMAYLREQKVYELFMPDAAMEEAWSIVSDMNQRGVVESLIMGRCVVKTFIQKVNRANNWKLTEEGIQSYQHYFWNTSLMTFDQWGRFLYDRSANYSDYLAFLKGTPALLMFKLRIEQHMESKDMIKRAQEISYYTLEQVNLIPGTDSAKVKSIGILTKSLTDCDASLSASDAQLSNVLKQFEQFRTEHNQLPAVSIKELAPGGNFSGSGMEIAKKEKVQH